MVSSPAFSTGSLVFQQNDYFSPSGIFNVAWGGTHYTALSSWQNAAKQELLGTTQTGRTVDPKLTNPGHGGTIGNADNLSALTAYVLLPTTPLLNSGLDLSTFGIAMGGHDFYGVPVPLGSAPEIGASEIG
jgi:hypothetical protein